MQNAHAFLFNFREIMSKMREFVYFETIFVNFESPVWAQRQKKRGLQGCKPRSLFLPLLMGIKPRSTMSSESTNLSRMRQRQNLHTPIIN